MWPLFDSILLVCGQQVGQALDRGTSPIINSPPPLDPPRTLDIGLRYGHRQVRFLVCEVSLYRPQHIDGMVSTTNTVHESMISETWCRVQNPGFRVGWWPTGGESAVPAAAYWLVANRWGRLVASRWGERCGESAEHGAREHGQ